MAEYDNTDRIAMWGTEKQAWTGKGNLDGRDFYATLAATGALAEKAPSHKLFIEFDRSNCVCVPLWRDEEGKPSFASGTHGNYFVNAYLNQGDKPMVTVKFKAKQQVASDAMDKALSSPAPQRPAASSGSLI